MSDFDSSYDVVVVGAGNAGLSAALEALDRGASVLILERGTVDERGGNSRFTAGAVRFAFNGVDDLVQLVPDLSEDELSRIDFGTYTADAFYADVARITKYRADPELADLLVRKSFEAMKFWQDNGVRFTPAFRRQAFEIDGKFTFWGGIALETVGGGPGLVEALFDTVISKGAVVAYETRALDLLYDKGQVHGVRLVHGQGTFEVESKAVVLAAGGFQANAEWRTRYLGPGWDLARVRGTWANTGDGIRMALDIGASPAGHWSGAHAVPWDLNAPEFGDLAVGDQFSKLSYPLGIMLNADGNRFLNEGADFRNFTYAKYGREIISQPDQFAWQVFDDKATKFLRDEYHIMQATRVRSDTLEGLVAKMDGVDPDVALATIHEYNDAVQDDVAYNPNVKDGRGTDGLDVEKSNWATKLDTPPYSAYAVTCGVTFTFGGLRIDEQARVIASGGNPIPGLTAAGELVGGLFYHNYPGGSGLTAGTVFGRIAGATAAGTDTPK
jgi:tricarballylate dehydrogenase